MPGGVVIAGSGQAGIQTALSLREAGYDGRIRVVGDEPHLPYERPPLSKAYLAADGGDPDSVTLRTAAFYTSRSIEVISAERIVTIERERKRLRCASGTTIEYEHLVLALGARNRNLMLSGDAADILYLRTLAEASVLRARLARSQRIAIVGGGFIGLEVAAAVAAAGGVATVMELLPRLLSRVASNEVSAHVLACHRAAGTRVVLGTGIRRIDAATSDEYTLELTDGVLLEADAIVAGIGSLPNVELAADAGLPTANGIVVDAMLATPDPAISAIGDCAAFPQPMLGAMTRLESVQNAVDQARCVAARLTGSPRAYAAVPWFWSDQGSLKLQMAGVPVACDRTVVRGDRASGSFSVFGFIGERLIYVESVNAPVDHVIARKLLAGSEPCTPEDAADTTRDLRKLLAS